MSIILFFLTANKDMAIKEYVNAVQIIGGGTQLIKWDYCGGGIYNTTKQKGGQ
jgi:hypothetical protein